MALALILIGIVLLVAGVRNTQGDLFTLVSQDFTGTHNFLSWAAAIILIGAIGFIPKLKPISIALLTLVFVAIFLKKGTGFFDSVASATTT